MEACNFAARAGRGDARAVTLLALPEWRGLRAQSVSRRRNVVVLEHRLAARIIVDDYLSARVTGLGNRVWVARAPDHLDGAGAVERRARELAGCDDHDLPRALDHVLDALRLGLARLGPAAVVHHDRGLRGQHVQVGGDDLPVGAVLLWQGMRVGDEVA